MEVEARKSEEWDHATLVTAALCTPSKVLTTSQDLALYTFSAPLLVPANRNWALKSKLTHVAGVSMVWKFFDLGCRGVLAAR